MTDAAASRDRRSLREVAAVFLKLGVIGFGGPAAHVALMRRELVERRRWLDEDRFLELFGAASLIPGPSSTELGMMLGYERAGWPGLLVAGTCFIVPAMLLVLAIAWAYVRYGSLPQTDWILYGIGPVIIAVILDAFWQLGRRALTSIPLAAVAVTVMVLYLLGVDVVVLLFGAAILVMLGRNIVRMRAEPQGVIPILPLLAAAEAPLRSVFLEFLKLGAVVYGSGYVLLAFLRSDLVEHLHWIGESRLIDAVAVGQVTPGPVFTTATFIGYLVAGLPGALVATAGIFLPAFALSAIVFPLLPRLRRSPWASAFLTGVTVSGLALMAGVTFQLGRVVIVDAFTAVVAIVAFVVLRRFQPNSAWLVLGGAVVGLIARGP
ncbi:MAG TPA: chromate efflux transporter [Actinomycetota bacterium]|nr:chromate efflux transporter [Actinomycetota bacterium]